MNDCYNGFSCSGVLYHFVFIVTEFQLNIAYEMVDIIFGDFFFILHLLYETIFVVANRISDQTTSPATQNQHSL